MPAILRVGDIGFGVCSGKFFIATVVTGLGPYDSSGQAISGVGCIAASTCGHPVIIATGSPLCEAGGRKVARVGDIGYNKGICTFVTGSPTHDLT